MHDDLIDKVLKANLIAKAAKKIGSQTRNNTIMEVAGDDVSENEMPKVLSNVEGD
jgi:hypothetical protein